MLSPIEIKKQEFSRAVRGFDTDEVRSYLETVADEFEKLLEQTNSSGAELDKLKTELASYQRIEQNMKEALVNAQETLRQARDGSRREADLTKREAELDAEKIINDAKKQGEGLRREVESLIMRRDMIVRKLKSILKSELELIELLEDDDFGIPSVTESNESDSELDE